MYYAALHGKPEGGRGGMWEKSAKFLAYTPQDRWTLFAVGLFVTDSNTQL